MRTVCHSPSELDVHPLQELARADNGSLLLQIEGHVAELSLVPSCSLPLGIQNRHFCWGSCIGRVAAAVLDYGC